MSAKLIDGKALARKIHASLKTRVIALKSGPAEPKLLVITSRQPDQAAQSYGASQKKAFADVGVALAFQRGDWKDARGVLQAVETGRKPGICVLFDLPLDPAVDVEELVSLLPPELDAEGVAPFNVGRLCEVKSYAEIKERSLIVPCTASAVAELILATGAPLSGKRAAVLGRSNIVGKPAAHLLTCLDMTVTVCHSKTADLPAVVREADVVVAAMGKPKLVKPDWIKPGAVVVDAGINMEGGKLCGDVDPACAERAGHLSPVPGGVGPVTTAMLLANTVLLAERAARRPFRC